MHEEIHRFLEILTVRNRPLKVNNKNNSFLIRESSSCPAQAWIAKNGAGSREPL